MRTLARLPAAILLTGFVLFITLPFVMILLEAFGADWFGMQLLPGVWTLKWFRWAAQTVDIGTVLLNTGIIALLATAFSLLLSIPAAWAIARHRLPVKSLLMGAILFPRMIPEITFALGVAKMFYALGLANTYVGIALSHVILAAPFAVLVLTSTFEGLDSRLLEAGAVLGCRPAQLFLRVILPLALPGIVAAALFSFLASYNDFVLTLMVYGPDTVTLPVQTYLSIGNGYTSVASAISVILLIPSVLFLLGLMRMVRPENLLGGLKGA
ncbi:MAG TPA: ABC transporter permease [Acetobacteraceae bacterium]|nr:ABC transporter permease [Acetobacteraceae bacterium]